MVKRWKSKCYSTLWTELRFPHKIKSYKCRKNLSKWQIKPDLFSFYHAKSVFSTNNVLKIWASRNFEWWPLAFENHQIIQLVLFINPLYTEIYTQEVIICDAIMPMTSICISLSLNPLLMRSFSRKPCRELLSFTPTSSLQMSDAPK